MPTKEKPYANTRGKVDRSCLAAAMPVWTAGYGSDDDTAALKNMGKQFQAIVSEWNHFPESSSHWSFATSNIYLSSHSGDANDWPIHLHGTADGEYEYTGETRLHGNFCYEGDDEATVYMGYSVHFNGYVEAWLSNATGVCHFTAKPGHDYHVYINMKIYGISGAEENAKSSICMEDIDYVYLYF